MFALRQLDALRRRGQDLASAALDPGTVAGIIGIAGELEFVSDGPLGRSYHFPDEVLVNDGEDAVPWTLLDLDTWALLTEAASLDSAE